MHHAHLCSKGLLICLYNLTLFWKALVRVQHLRAACHTVWVRAFLSDIMVYTALAKNNVRPWKSLPVSPFPLPVFLMVSPSPGIISLFGAQHTFITQWPAKVHYEGQRPKSQSRLSAEWGGVIGELWWLLSTCQRPQDFHCRGKCFALQSGYTVPEDVQHLSDSHVWIDCVATC